jgi:hypothetical protein
MLKFMFAVAPLSCNLEIDQLIAFQVHCVPNATTSNRQLAVLGSELPENKPEELAHRHISNVRLQVRWAPHDDVRVGRLTELELEVRHYHDRAAHAEKWLARIHQDILGSPHNPKFLWVDDAKIVGD